MGALGQITIFTVTYAVFLVEESLVFANAAVINPTGEHVVSNMFEDVTDGTTFEHRLEVGTQISAKTVLIAGGNVQHGV